MIAYMQSYSGFNAPLVQRLEFGSYEPTVAGSSPARSKSFVFIDYNSNAYFLRLYYKRNTMARNQKSRRSSSGSRKSRKYGKNTYKGGKSNASKRGTRRSGRVMQHGG
jgi:hypothetical protein